MEADMKRQLRALKSLAGPFPPFDPDAAPDEPDALFVVWLQDAIDAGVMEPHAMTLSTVDEEGRPDARVQILRNLDEQGWHFATTMSGPKDRQIAANPSVALTFYWPQLGRQVRIRGSERGIRRTGYRFSGTSDWVARGSTAFTPERCSSLPE